MKAVCRFALAALLCGTVTSVAFAQQPDQQKPDPQKPAAQKPDQKPEEKPADQPQKYEETVVVSASKIGRASCRERV